MNPNPTWKPNHDLNRKPTTMGLTIDDTIMTSDQSPHTAQQLPGSPHEWEVSWLLDRDTAITAMILADIAATGDIHPDHRLWPAVQSWSAELGLTGPGAISQASQPPPMPPSSPSYPGPGPGDWSPTWTGRPPIDQLRTASAASCGPGSADASSPGAAPTRTGYRQRHRTRAVL